MAKSSKGSAFERQMAKYFSQWITGDKDTEYLIYRAQGSGSMGTMARIKGKKVQKNLEGDLIAVDDRAKFFMDKVSIECKNGYKTASLFSTFKNSKSDVLKSFWVQAFTEAKSSNKTPLLIFKPLGNSPLVGVTNDFLCSFPEICNLEQRVVVRFNKELPDLNLFRLEEVFNIITPEKFKERI